MCGYQLHTWSSHSSHFQGARSHKVDFFVDNITITITPDVVDTSIGARPDQDDILVGGFVLQPVNKNTQLVEVHTSINTDINLIKSTFVWEQVCLFGPH